jgi:hypothetical protein
MFEWPESIPYIPLASSEAIAGFSSLYIFLGESSKLLSAPTRMTLGGDLMLEPLASDRKPFLVKSKEGLLDGS